jgi:AcrR family transcriptional regulator
MSARRGRLKYSLPRGSFFIAQTDRSVNVQDALLDAAFAVLVREGPGFGIASVAREADASKALVFHHFGTREGLLDAMAARVLSETQEGLTRLAQDHPPRRARIEALARTLLEEPRGTRPKEARHVMAFWLLTDATGSCRGALRDALIADFIGDERAATLLLSRWHGATALYASGRAIDFEREQERVVDELAALRL